MACPICGGEPLPDLDTGYRGDDICPSCAERGWDVGPDGALFQDTVIEQRELITNFRNIVRADDSPSNRYQLENMERRLDELVKVAAVSAVGK